MAATLSTLKLNEIGVISMEVRNVKERSPVKTLKVRFGSGVQSTIRK
jgi:hypothetical protein